jgi:hypothetical protein
LRLLEIVQIIFKAVAPKIDRLFFGIITIVCKLERLGQLCNDLDHIISVFKECIVIDVDNGEPENVDEALTIASEILLVSVATEATEKLEAVDGKA